MVTEQLKNEKEILDLVLSIPVEKWMQQFKRESINGGDKVIVACELHLKGVSLVLNIFPGSSLRVWEFEYVNEDILDLAKMVRLEIDKSRYNQGELILNNLLVAKKHGVI